MRIIPSSQVVGSLVFSVCALWLVACGSADSKLENADDTVGSGASTSGGVAGSAGAAAGGGASGGSAGSASGGANGGSAGSESGGAGGSAGSAAVVCQEKASEADWGENCLACAKNDCQSCLCTGCKAELEHCDETAGCREIAACVESTGCVGLACYCGTSSALDCVGGRADGPCKEVVLGAPGGKMPTLADTSAGPASDAALAIADCSTAPQGACGDACQ